MSKSKETLKEVCDIVWSAWKHAGEGLSVDTSGVVLRATLNLTDEHLHSEASAWLFRTLKQELKDAGEIDEAYEKELEKDIYTAAQNVLEHEKILIAKIFERGKIEGITEKQLEHFAESRINLCLRNMGYENLYKVEYNPVASWFYSGINGYQMQDFFNSQGNQYVRDWSEQGFSF